VAVSRRLVLDPTACQAHGLCADLLPERITLDEWGYPIVDPTPVTGGLAHHARRAVATCPTLALALEPVRPNGPQRSPKKRPSRG
jgi:ferredoxin